MDSNDTIFAALADGKCLAHTTINTAIDECAKRGGGCIRIPSGRYLCGTIFLRSNVLLELSAGAQIVGTDDLNQYDSFLPQNSAEGHLGERWHRSLIIAEDVSNTGIVGQGTINGAKVFDAEGEEHMRGPHTIIAGNSNNLIFRDFSVIDSANYAFLAEYCDDLDFRNLTIKGGWDGIHIRGQKGRSCERIRIFGCDIRTGDDAIAGRYWDDCVISNCQINSSCNGVRVIGPAMRLAIHNCIFYGPGQFPHITQSRYNALAAILLQPGSWDPTEGELDQVVISNNTVIDHECALATYIKPGNHAGSIIIDGLKATGIYGPAMSFESWTETPIKSLLIRDVAIDYMAEAISDQLIESNDIPHVGLRDLPAWALYCFNVESVSLDNVRMTIDGDDARPAFAAKKVGRITRRLCELKERIMNPPLQECSVQA